jgi:3-oxoacyl-[acyl-carrier-protein] synthase-1
VRAKLTNPKQTRCIDSEGQWVMGHQVPLESSWQGLAKLARMAAMAVDEAMSVMPASLWSRVPLLLCVAETDRPGRVDGLDDRLLSMIEQELRARFAPQSTVIPHGRVAVAVALSQAGALVHQHGIERVLIVATDSLLDWRTLSHYESAGRLLTPGNSNGFMPGEGAGAMLVGKPATSGRELVCQGVGFAMEPAHIDSDEPLRADGLSQAIKSALGEAGCEMHDMDYRITDLSGEQYYFKEASLSLSRTLRRLKDEFDLWHPAECTGEAGALAGAVAVAVAREACAKGYTRGSSILVHLANDNGKRAALALRFGGS